MTQDELSTVLETLSATPNKDGWTTLPDGRTLTVYAAHDGVPLTIARVDGLATQGPLFRARTVKGELYLLALGDVFALATEGATNTTRKPGFL